MEKKEPVLRKKQGIETGLATEKWEKRGKTSKQTREKKPPIFYLFLCGEFYV